MFFSDFSVKSESPIVAFACGSRSTIKVLISETARLKPTLTADVVLPTPPFWFINAKTFPMVKKIVLKLILNIWQNKKYKNIINN